jgi:hypothetical protein
MADDPLAGLPLRSDPGASASTPPRSRLGDDRHQPGQGRRRQPHPAQERTASVRVVGGTGSACEGNRAAVRADDSVHSCDRAAAGGVDRPRETRRRPQGARRLRPPLLHARRTQDHEDRGEHASGPAPGSRDRRAGRVQDGNRSPLLFPGERGGYLDIHHFRPFQWRHAQKALAFPPSTSLATWAPA